MANESKKRRVRPAPTVREKAAETPKKTGTNRRVISRPFKSIGSFTSKLLRPFRFILWPFKTRPVRFIGRILAAILLLRYFRGAWHELRDVTWPSRKETTQLTFAVFVFAIIFGILVAVTDYGLDKLFKKVLLK